MAIPSTWTTMSLTQRPCNSPLPFLTRPLAETCLRGSAIQRVSDHSEERSLDARSIGHQRNVPGRATHAIPIPLVRRRGVSPLTALNVDSVLRKRIDGLGASPVHPVLFAPVLNARAACFVVHASTGRGGEEEASINVWWSTYRLFLGRQPVELAPS